MKRAAWVLSLIGASILWFVFGNKARYGAAFEQLSLVEKTGMYIGSAGFVLVITGILAWLPFGYHKRGKTAMWTWTVLFLVAVAFLSIGQIAADRIARQP